MAVDALGTDQPTNRHTVLHFRYHLHAFLNRGLPDGVGISLRVRWPLVILPFALINQILAPHPVWLALVIALTGLYGFGLFWVRSQAPNVTATRERTGSILVAGDTLSEEFELRNYGRLPLLWAEFIDESSLPGHSPGQIVACGSYGFYRWRSDVVCERRGVFRLGPHRLRFGDPFGLFSVEIVSVETELLLIYPRVAHLPELEQPHGNAGESRRRRRPLRGALPSASVTDYRPGDSLRNIHWRSTAKRSRLMVKELEIEPSGDVWIVLDLNRSAQSGTGKQGTLEYSVIVAASIAAKLLSEGERRSVGLLTVSGQFASAEMETAGDDQLYGKPRDIAQDNMGADVDRQAVLLPPQPGQAQLWHILSALAPVEPTDVTLADLLHNSREILGRRRTLVIVTAETDIEPSSESYEHRASASGPGCADRPTRSQSEDGRQRNWLSELVHLRASGLDSTVLLVSGPGDHDEQGSRSSEPLRGLLASEDIASQALKTDQPLKPALTFRRTRRVIRSTPTGGAVTYEIEEDVG